MYNHRASHRLASSPLGLSRKRVCLVLPGQTRTYSHDLTGANRSVVHSLPRQHVSQAIADVVHFLSSLSSKSRFRPEQYGRRLQAWRYPIQIIRCPQ